MRRTGFLAFLPGPDGAVVRAVGAYQKGVRLRIVDDEARVHEALDFSLREEGRMTDEAFARFVAVRPGDCFRYQKVWFQRLGREEAIDLCARVLRGSPPPLRHSARKTR